MTTEAERLATIETVIEGGLAELVEVGLALAEIRDTRLYRSRQEFGIMDSINGKQIPKRRARQLAIR